MLGADEDIIDALYRLYEQLMYYEAFKILHDGYLAEDAVHEAFVRLIRHRGKITNPSVPDARGYVFKTLRCAALDLYRNRKKQGERCCALDETLEETCASEDTTPDLPLSMIAELPEKYAAVMRCLFIDGLSIRETAAVLRIREDLVRKRCERARKLLRPALISTHSNKETHHEG
jgi:RNA polymerase sigma-70 factor (ECF subfamily)